MGYWINRVEGLEPPFQVVHEQVIMIPAQGHFPVTNTARKLLFVLSGECRHQIPALTGPHRNVHLRPGDILAIPYLCEQRYAALQAGDAGRIHVVRVAFDPARLSPLPLPAFPPVALESDMREGIEGLAARCINEVIYLRGGAEQGSLAAETLNALRDEARLRRPEYPLRVYGLCVSLIVLFARQVQETRKAEWARQSCAPGEVPAAEFHVSKIKSYLSRHLSQPLSLSQIAEHVCLSEEHTVRLFKKVTGTTLSAYERRLRIAEAKNLLVATELNLGEIALRSGFASLTVFSRNFKRETGMTPSEFRQQIAQQMG